MSNVALDTSQVSSAHILCSIVNRDTEASQLLEVTSYLSAGTEHGLTSRLTVFTLMIHKIL